MAATALAIAALGGTTSTVLAYGTPTACVQRTEVRAFALWGDSATYFLVSNGSFERGSTNWALRNGAAVVSDADPYRISGWADTHSLVLPPGSSAESRTLCVSVGEDTLRFMVMNPHVSGAILHVDAVAENPSTGAKGYAAFDVNGDVPSETWAPTIILGIPRMFGGNGTQSLTLYFSLRGTAATWQIDDVYVDPFKSW